MKARGPALAIVPAAVLAAVLVALAAACRPQPATPHEAALAHAPLVVPEDIAGSFLWEQEVTVTWRGHEHTFRAALQKRGAALDVLGLTPFGTRLFLVQQRGQQVEYTSFGGPALPFPPRAMLLEIDRTYFVQLPDPPHDGVQRGRWHDELIEDVWQGGRRRSRSCLPEGGADPILIQYQGPLVEGIVPARVHLQNQALGYELDIRTLVVRPLP